MNAFRFSDNFNDSTALKMTELEKNNFSNMKMLKSIYDDSFDVANNFFRGGGVEGFKSKSSAKKVFAKSKTAAKSKKAAKKADAAKKKVDAAKKDAEQAVEDAEQNAEEAKDEAKDAADAEEVAVVTEGNEEGEGEEFANYNDSDNDSDVEGFDNDNDSDVEGFDNDNDSDNGSIEWFDNDSDSDVEGFDNDSIEGFDNDSDSDNGSIEGMKSKKKKKKSKKKKSKKKKKKSKKNKSSKKKKKISIKYPDNIPNFDLIGWIVQQAKGSKNDENTIKTILNSLFVTFLSFLIAHNWYYTFFVNPTKFRLEDAFSFLKENEFTHFFTIYIVEIVKAIDIFIMENIPGKFNSAMENTLFGKRSVFFLILSVSLMTVPYFLTQLKSILEYLRNQINGLIDVIKSYNKSPVGLRNYIHNLISTFFDSILLFKGNALLSGLIGITFVVKYMENVMVDHSKGIIENATEVIPSFFTKMLSGNFFYIIYLVFKFAMFYQPTIAFSSFIITAYLFYFSIVRLTKINGIFGTFSAISENNRLMNDGKVLFNRDVFSRFKNGIEDALRFIMRNSHQIILLFTLKANIGRIVNIESKTFKTVMLGLGITSALAILYTVLEKYGIGQSEVKELGNEFDELSAEIKQNIEKQDLKKTSGIETMFERIYKPYKSV